MVSTVVHCEAFSRIEVQMRISPDSSPIASIRLCERYQFVISFDDVQ